MFGKKRSGSGGSEDQVRISHEHERVGSQAAPGSLSIVDQLLSALDARERDLEQEEQLSRQCADQLLGRRNVFVPEIRMQDHRQQQDAQRSPNVSDDASAVAHEIIKNRFQIELRADTLRCRQKTPSAVRAPRPETKASRSSVGFATRAKKSTPTASVDAIARHRATVTEQALEDATTKIPRSLFVLEDLCVRKDTSRDARGARATAERVSRAGGLPKKRIAAASPASEDTGGDQIALPAAPKQHASSTTLTHRAVGADPIRRMEQRQQRVRDMKLTRVAASKHLEPQEGDEEGDDWRERPPSRPTVVRTKRSSNQENANTTYETATIKTTRREERVLQDRIRRLASENQRAAELEDRARERRQQRQAKAAVFALWREQVDQQGRQEAQAHQVFVWRLVLRTWGTWKQWTRAMTTQRLEQETRARLVREKAVATQAEAFWRQKQLPKWFYRWCSCVQAAKVARELEAAQQKRKEQAQRLMERLLRQQTAPEDVLPLSRQDQQDASCGPAMVEAPALPTGRHTAERKVGTRATRSQYDSVAGVSPSQYASTKLVTHVDEELRPSPEPLTIDTSAQPADLLPPVPPQSAGHLKSASTITSRHCPAPAVDPLYASMQERAAERKERRDRLKQRYEHLEQAKREAVAAQMVEIEAQVAQQKIDERARVRERKRQEALAAHEKAQRLEQLDGQRRAARCHDCKRLVFYYGFLPLRRHWETARRVAANVAAWHRLRVLHTSWLGWLQHVRDVHVERQHAERRQLQVAAKHHAQTLARSGIAALRALVEHRRSAEEAATQLARRHAQRRLLRRWQVGDVATRTA